MRRLACCALLALLLPLGCHRGQVRLRVAPDERSYVWRDPISSAECEQYWKQLLYPVQPPLGYAEGRQRGADGAVLNAKLRWNDCVQTLRGLFEVLCEQHNKGLTTLRQFQRRRARLVAASEDLTALRERFDAALSKYVAARQGLAEARSDEEGPPGESTQEPRARVDSAARALDELIEEAAGIVNKLEPPAGSAEAMARLSPFAEPAPSSP